MIDRYTRPEMKQIWSEENKYRGWLEVEIAADEAWSKLGHIPAEDVAKIRDHATFTVEGIAEIEAVTHHDVIAFTRDVSKSLGPDRKWVHYGLTSTDVVDTAQGYQLKQANDLLRQDIADFMAIVADLARKYKDTVCMGRTHGIHAEPTTCGLKAARWYSEMKRNQERFEHAAKGVEAGKISGAVGTFAEVDPFVEERLPKAGLAATRNFYPGPAARPPRRTRGDFGLDRDQPGKHGDRNAPCNGRKFTKLKNTLPRAKGILSDAAQAQPDRVGKHHRLCPVLRGTWLRQWKTSPSGTNATFPTPARNDDSAGFDRPVDYMLHRFGKIFKELRRLPGPDEAQHGRNLGLIYSGRVLPAGQLGNDREAAYDLIQPYTAKCWPNTCRTGRSWKLTQRFKSN